MWVYNKTINQNTKVKKKRKYMQYKNKYSVTLIGIEHITKYITILLVANRSK